MVPGRFARAALIGAAAAISVAAAAQQASPPAPGTTVQQDYDAATALDQGADAAAALAAWVALAARVKSGNRTWAIAMVRKGGAQFRLGQLDEAAATIRAGLAVLPTADASLAEDRQNAHIMLGRIAADSLDYADASAEYAKAEAEAPTDVGRLAAMLAGARVRIFTDPADALATLDRADAIASRMTLGKVDQASLLQARMRLAMNIGHLDEANRIAPKVVSLLGGMTLSRVDLRDVAARSDAAIAALLAHRDDTAREYMAYTGAGRSRKGMFRPASLMTPPECGGEADLKPEDVAVVQFGVGDDGSVFGVEPVYSSGGGEKGLAFARAVQGWAWSPEELKTLPPFFRYSVRLEMRCSTAYSRPSVNEAITARFAEWVDKKGVAAPAQGHQVGGVALGRQRAALAAAEARGQAPAILAAAAQMFDNPTLGSDERAALIARVEPLAAASDMPAMARLLFAIPAQEGRDRDWRGGGRYAAVMAPLLTQKPYADDPQARAALRLRIADHSNEKYGAPYLQQVADDPGLDPRDPLRVGALIRLASAAKREGDLALARQTFEKSGLAASQCATLDAKPKPVVMPGPDVFPQEARRWGFEGWVRNQFDVGADGHVTNTRTLVSYPPFIFSQAAEKAFTSMRFQKTYRPDGGVGCGASVNGIVFQLP
ncbi:energy transducer TonB [Sphingomonadaceae bacterium jetA1]|jgi:tetratricopeptide (TPR) repeat protein|uniref:energy transducer TonB n=1 Tax=Facivitalis istanbulensis TaxID=3075838 RepID=UPI003479E5E4